MADSAAAYGFVERPGGGLDCAANGLGAGPELVTADTGEGLDADTDAAAATAAAAPAAVFGVPVAAVVVAAADTGFFTKLIVNGSRFATTNNRP